MKNILMTQKLKKKEKEPRVYSVVVSGHDTQHKVLHMCVAFDIEEAKATTIEFIKKETEKHGIPAQSYDMLLFASIPVREVIAEATDFTLVEAEPVVDKQNKLIKEIIDNKDKKKYKKYKKTFTASVAKMIESKICP